jgi:uncharacterized protein with PQ loop repeat
MDFGYLIGWIGVGFGIGVPIPQLIKMRNGCLDGISLHTYIFLVIALSCYLAHAIYIHAVVFIVAQAINLTTNSIILARLRRAHRAKNTDKM